MRLKSLHIAALALAMAVLSSCEEFQPVFTCKYPDPAVSRVYSESDMTGTKVTIAELKAMYKGKPVEIDDDIYIAGKVTTCDLKGNFYRSFFIQDETSGIEIKIGKYNLYNEYKEGQTIFVRCKGLTVGAYKGMVGLGYRVEDTSSSYETAYIEVQYIVDRSIFRGPEGEKVQPRRLTSASELDKSIGCLVELPGMQYTHHIFFMGYVDYNGNRKDYTNNCYFCDEEGTWEVPTWAMSADKYEEYLRAGTFDAAEVRGTTVGKLFRSGVPFSKVAYSVSQYFTFKGKSIQVRTSGYSKWADKDIDPTAGRYQDILKGKTVTMRGVLSTYNGEYQFTINDIDTDFTID